MRETDKQQDGSLQRTPHPRKAQTRVPPEDRV